ncbi:MAG: response regulator transcription factor [Chloroflexi bacterium]|nr:response regulator transcription factor [Chloroflexota bacterium]
MSVTKILVADDHPVVRKGLVALLDTHEDFSVIGEAADGIEAVELADRLKPNVLVLDLMMPGLNGLEVTRQVSELSPKTNIIILSIQSIEAYVLNALRAGAIGYVLKNSPPDILAKAVRNAAAGRFFLGPPLSERAVEIYIQKSRGEDSEAAPDGPYENLTRREREILHLVLEGSTSTKIAKSLSISPRTVETHRSNFMRKLNLRKKSELFNYALEQGILRRDGGEV